WSSQPKQGYRLAKLCSNQFEADAVRISKSCHLRAATDRKPGCCRLIRAAMSAAAATCSRCPPACPPRPRWRRRDATDTQPICPALVVQGACAAPGAGNELCLDDRKVDSAGLRIAIDRRPYHHDSCSLNFLFLAPVTESTGEPDAAALRRLVRLLY